MPVSGYILRCRYRLQTSNKTLSCWKVITEAKAINYYSSSSRCHSSCPSRVCPPVKPFLIEPIMSCFSASRADFASELVAPLNRHTLFVDEYLNCSGESRVTFNDGEKFLDAKSIGQTLQIDLGSSRGAIYKLNILHQAINCCNFQFNYESAEMFLSHFMASLSAIPPEELGMKINCCLFSHSPARERSVADNDF